MLYNFIFILFLLASVLADVDGTVYETRLKKATQPKKSNLVDSGFLAIFLDNLKAEIQQYNKMKILVEELSKKTSKMQAQLDAFKTSSGPRANVAFYVWLQNENTAQNRIIKYDRVVTNTGNGYNVNTGQFVAPFSGTYVFAVTLMDKRGPAHLNIMKNNIEVGAVRSERTGDLDMGTQVVVLNLKASDRVYLKNHINHGLHSHSGRYAFNTFSGFLI